ncbi:MAG: AAA family ATPase [Okeania sp. SIO2F4]|uniref:AAA family ATPase n=1 Tax=Okeania sp. SIO2F4 TaxID=2607790 RepID=UPI001429F2E9|nr:AAA family ATPase [Okeania sp. SIO2F4]NES01846.1 AAA family ATPase [Okeania sp. SIO2F4]
MSGYTTLNKKNDLSKYYRSDRNMSVYIKHLEAKGIYGIFDINLDFHQGVNVLFAKNGKGKTTLLHIIANLLNEDYERFAFIDFDYINLRMSDKNQVELKNNRNDEEIILSLDGVETKKIIFKRTKEINTKLFPIISEVASTVADLCNNIPDKSLEEQSITAALSAAAKVPINYNILNQSSEQKLITAAYFPAFRSMIEAWASTEEKSGKLRDASDEKKQQQKTNFARQIFGEFVPLLNYPSVIEIEQALNKEISQAFYQLNQAQQKYLGNILPQIFNTLSKNSKPVEEDSNSILEEIKQLNNELKFQMLEDLRTAVESFQADEKSKETAAKILITYREALQKISDEQKTYFQNIEKYLAAVNSFLDSKEIEIIFKNLPILGINFQNGMPAIPGISKALSSGERQILTMIYAASQMSEQNIVLIDEPEISLHVDWQRKLLEKISQQLGEKQIIACTHSPVVGADYEDEIIILEPKIIQN